MDYKEQIAEYMDEYYNDILVKYKEVTVAATKDGKKLAIFRKIDFSGHIAGFKELEEKSKALGQKVSAMDIPEDDENAMELEKKFEVSLDDFIKLCVRNQSHYDLMDRKQYSKNGVTLDDFKLSLAGTNVALRDSVGTLNELDQAYMIFTGKAKPEDFEEQTAEDEEADDGDAEDAIDPEDASYINSNDEDPDEEDEIEEELRSRPRRYKKQKFEDEE